MVFKFSIVRYSYYPIEIEDRFVESAIMKAKQEFMKNNIQENVSQRQHRIIDHEDYSFINL